VPRRGAGARRTPLGRLRRAELEVAGIDYDGLWSRRLRRPRPQAIGRTISARNSHSRNHRGVMSAIDSIFSARGAGPHFEPASVLLPNRVTRASGREWGIMYNNTLVARSNQAPYKKVDTDRVLRNQSAASKLNRSDNLSITIRGHGGQVRTRALLEPTASINLGFLYDGELIDDDFTYAALKQFVKAVRIFVLSEQFCHSGTCAARKSIFLLWSVTPVRPR